MAEQEIPKLSDLDPQYWSSGLSAQLMYLKVSKLANELTEKYNKNYLDGLKSTIEKLGIELDAEQQTMIAITSEEYSTNTVQYKDFFDYIYQLLLKLKDDLEQGVEPNIAQLWAEEIQNQADTIKESRIKELKRSKYTYLNGSTISREIQQDTSLTNSQMKVIWEPTEPNQFYDYYVKLFSKNKLKAEYNITKADSSVTILATPGSVWYYDSTQIKINELGGVEITPNGSNNVTLTIATNYSHDDTGVFYVVTNAVSKIKLLKNQETNTYTGSIQVIIEDGNKEKITLYPVHLEEKIHPNYPPNEIMPIDEGIIFLPELSFPFSQERRTLIDTDKYQGLICDFNTIAFNEPPSSSLTNHYFDIDRGVRGYYTGATTAISAPENSTLLGLWFPPIGTKGLTNFREGRAVEMTTMLMPPTVASLSNGVFREHSTLKTIYFSPNITNIPNQCCYHGVIENIYFGGSETSIGNKAFLNNDIESIIFPSSLNNIGLRAFFGSRKTFSAKFASTEQLHIHGDAFNYTGQTQRTMTLDFSECSSGWPKLYLDWERASSGNYYIFKMNGQNYFYNMVVEGSDLGAKEFPESVLKNLSWDTNKQHYYNKNDSTNSQYWYKPYRIRFMTGLGISAGRVKILVPNNWGDAPSILEINHEQSIGGEKPPKIDNKSIVELIYENAKNDIILHTWSYYDDKNCIEYVEEATS